jgi:hypothetical protein
MCPAGTFDISRRGGNTSPLLYFGSIGRSVGRRSMFPQMSEISIPEDRQARTMGIVLSTLREFKGIGDLTIGTRFKFFMVNDNAPELIYSSR